jgi:hypothetical protein
VDRTVATPAAAGPPIQGAESDLAFVHAPSKLVTPGTAGSQVVAGNIPQEPPGFQSRADLLAVLDRAGAGVSVVHPVTERPGVGTTQLAAAYARAKLAEGWRLVAWVSAEDTRSIRAGLAAVAEAVGLSNGGSGRDASDPGRVVRRHLETQGNRCLLVFDNAEDPDALRAFIPAAGAARVLITSPRQSMMDLGTSVPVGLFSTDEALAFLAARTGLTNDPGAAAVAAELGHLPLALAQATAVIAEEHLGYGTYLERLWALPVRERPGQEDRHAYPYHMPEVVLLSLQAALKTDPADVCTGMMHIIALLSSAGVRRELLHIAGQAGVLADGGHQVTAPQVDRSLEQLAERSLLSFSLDGQSIMVHPLMARAIRERLVRTGGLTAACKAAASQLV